MNLLLELAIVNSMACYVTSLSYTIIACVIDLLDWNGSLDLGRVNYSTKYLKFALSDVVGIVSCTKLGRWLRLPSPKIPTPL
jgi:hypothetical protein